MLTIGDILGSARRSAAGFEQWIETVDPGLAAEARSAAALSGESLAAFARSAVVDFSRLADEETWAHLMSTIRDSPDPGAECLVAMLRWHMRGDNQDCNPIEGTR